MIGLIIPIPLLIPVGSNKNIFVIEDNIIKKTIIRSTETSSALLCGFVPVGHIGFGCYVK